MWVADANAGRFHADVLTVVNYYRMLAGGMDVVLFPPVRLTYAGKNDLMVYPSIAAIIRRGGPRRICEKNHEHQVYEGPPNFVVEIESKHGFTDMQGKLQVYEAVGVQEALLFEHGKVATLYQMQGGKFTVAGQEPSGVVQSAALPGCVIDFAKLKDRKWLQMMEDIKESVGKMDVDKELTRQYGL